MYRKLWVNQHYCTIKRWVKRQARQHFSPTLCSSALDSEPSLRWPVSQGGCGLSERRFLPLRFRACLLSRQPTVSAWSPPSPKPPRAACSELSSSADTRSWTSSSIVRRKCLKEVVGKRKQEGCVTQCVMTRQAMTDRDQQCPLVCIQASVWVQRDTT